MKTTWKSIRSGILTLAMALGLLGCQTSQEYTPPTGTAGGAKSDPLFLREGDVLNIQFPGAPPLNTVQQVRRDGKIMLPALPPGKGEVMAAGKTTSDLEKELLKLYDDQLVTKQLTVTIQSSSFTIYVSGAVLRQGKISSERPMTALEAVMEAGVDYSKANLKKARVIRTSNGQTEQIPVDLSRAIKEGLVSKPFYLRNGDIVFVPEKFVLL